MTGRTTLALLVIALGLGAYIWFVEIGGEQRRAEQERVEKRILALESDAIQAVELPLDDDRRARIVRQGERWALEAPISFPADQGSVTSILNALEQLESREVFEDVSERLEQFGLGEEGRQRIEVWTGENGPVVLALGGESPIGAHRYVLVEDDPSRVYTIDRYRGDSLRPALDRLRESRISRLSGDEVTAVRVRERGRVVAVAERVPSRTAEADDAVLEWRVLEPVADRGDPVRIRRLIQDLSLARASGFVDEPDELSSYGLDPPELEVELVAGEESEQLAIGRGGSQVFARRADDDVVYEIHERTLEQVPRDSFAFRHKQVLSLDPAEVQQIEIHFPRGGDSHSFVRDEEGWRAVKEGVSIESERPENVVFSLEFVEATGIEAEGADRGALGLDPPSVRVVALDEKGTELGWLELGDPTPGLGMAAVSSEGERVWRVRNDLAEDIPVGAEAYENHWLTADEREAGDGEDALGEGEDLE